MQKLILFIYMFGLSSSIWATAPTWSVNPAAYQYQMTASSRVSIRCNDLNNNGVLVGAFVNGVCRGLDSNYVLNSGFYSTFITIYSNIQTGEKVIFKLYDPSMDVIYEAIDTLTFENNKNQSTTQYPYLFMSNYKPTAITLSQDIIYKLFTSGTKIADLSTIDKNNTSFQYSLLPGAEYNNDYFFIFNNELVLDKNLRTDTIKKLTIKIQTDDLNGCTYDSVFTFIINNNDPPPTGLVKTDSSIVEHVAVGTLAKKLIAIDLSPTDTFTYELVAGAGSEGNSKFKIVGDQLQVNFNFEYDTAKSYPIRIKITDLAQNTVEVNTHILIKEILYKLNPTDSLITEHLTIGSLAKTLSVNDIAYGGTNYTYELVAGAGSEGNSNFKITGDQLQVNSDLEYSNASFFSTRIKITNNVGNEIVVNAIILLREIKYMLKPTDSSIDEHVKVGTVAKIFDVNDIAFGGTVYTFELVEGVDGIDNYRYIITGNQLIVNTDIEYDSSLLHTLRIRMINAAGNKIEASFKIKINETINSSQPLKANNMISPNGDGINDVFEIYNIDMYNKFHLSIYDDNGYLVNEYNSNYSPENRYNNEWNGISKKGDKLPTGMYHYFFINADHSHIFKGNIYIMNSN